MSESYLPNAVILPYTPAGASWTNFPDLFKQVTVLKILNDFECPKTRQESSLLALNHALFANKGVSVIAVCEQPVGSLDFLKASGWRGELYMDLYKNVCRSTYSPDLSKPKPNMMRKPSRAPFQVGGTYVIGPDQRILYAHEPKSLLDSPRISHMLDACSSYDPSSPASPIKRLTFKFRKVKSFGIRKISTFSEPSAYSYSFRYSLRHL
ncbi:hypothetical protein DSO57_1003921 [Entomophthora muscae]|uniref:Uncharacterized protein n=1 Tax=Entomophthora muscae TaxID=34485 RepID=A0ACC2SAI1_9FUNG|nr:hypothetical protein DSO57_1003921 [Entomophthora muscae]